MLRQVGKQARIVDVERGRMDHVAETDVDQDWNADILEARLKAHMHPLLVFLLARALDKHRVARKGQTVIDVNLEFANGNGRWSRLMGDVLARYLDRPVFTWGGSQLLGDDDVRRAYLASLRKADGDDFTDLLTFARS